MNIWSDNLEHNSSIGVTKEIRELLKTNMSNNFKSFLPERMFYCTTLQQINIYGIASNCKYSVSVKSDLFDTFF